MKTKKHGNDQRKQQSNASAPDGGYAWLIVIAYGTANILIIPVLTSFGLIFKDKFKQLNLSSLDAALILNLNSALGMTLGLFNGALLKYFGYRKVAILGGFLFSSGLVATSFADSFQHFLITYSIITSIGMGLCTSSFSLAVNSYFNRNRNKAFGIGVTITGLGPIVFPQLISLLLGVYGSQGCVLIISAIAMNIIPAALLLQPVKWHEKKFKDISAISEIFPPLLDRKETALSLNLSILSKHGKSINSISENEDDYLDTCPIYHDIDSQSIYGVEIMQHPKRKSDESLWKDSEYKFEAVPTHRTSPDTGIELMNSSELNKGNIDEESDDNDSSDGRSLRWFESPSEHSIHLASSLQIYQEQKPKHHDGFFSKRHSIFNAMRRASMVFLPQRRNTSVGVIREEDEEGVTTPVTGRRRTRVFTPPPPLIQLPKKKSKLPKCLRPVRDAFKRFIKIFDLGLLTDKIYLNMMIGIAVAVFAEINFSLLTPFILNEFEYSTEQTAMFMSTLAIVDIFCRFLSPFIGDFLKQPPRIMLMLALLLLIITRSSLLFAHSYNEILIVAASLGLAKGIRSVYMNLVIPSYIPLNRLAAASGIQMVTNGIILLSMGSFVGVFHDIFGSYKICILFINFLTFLTLVLWTVELVVMKRRRARKAKNDIVYEIPKLEDYKVDVC